MSKLTEDWVASVVRDLPRVASRITDEWALHHKPDAGEFLSLKPYPPLSTPQHVIDAAQEAAAHPRSAPARGLSSLREGIAWRVGTECGIQIDPEKEILITNGGMSALHVVFLTLLEPGDEVIVPSPCYFLEGLVRRFGARLVFVPMDERRGFEWDLSRIEDAITKRTKVLFLNTPVNPTGRVLTLEELQEIGKIAEAHGICVLADESYDRLTYDGRRHISMLAVSGCSEHTVLVRSFTKSYIMPAWRVGYIVAEAGLTASFLKMFEWINLYANHVSQAAAAAAITGPQDWLADGASVMQANRDRALGEIQNLPFSCIRPEGGPFLFPNVAGLGMSGDAFAALLFQRFGVPAIPGAALQAPECVRIPFGATVDVIDELAARLCSAVRYAQHQAHGPQA